MMPIVNDIDFCVDMLCKSLVVESRKNGKPWDVFCDEDEKCIWKDEEEE